LPARRFSCCVLADGCEVAQRHAARLAASIAILIDPSPSLAGERANAETLAACIPEKSL
jgi:hypothetical protein